MNQKWLLIDMHMHSQFSKINKPGDKDKVKDMSAKEFVDILHNKKVEIFSITDHNYFSSDYYNIIDSYIKDSNLDMKLINGVELDVYVSLNDGKEDIIHVCFYFDNTVDRTELEKIINNLYKDENGNDKIEIRLILPITIAIDHRALDYGDVVPFMRKLDEIFDNPSIIQSWK